MQVQYSIQRCRLHNWLCILFNNIGQLIQNWLLILLSDMMENWGDNDQKTVDFLKFALWAAFSRSLDKKWKPKLDTPTAGPIWSEIFQPIAISDEHKRLICTYLIWIMSHSKLALFYIHSAFNNAGIIRQYSILRLWIKFYYQLRRKLLAWNLFHHLGFI